MNFVIQLPQEQSLFESSTLQSQNAVFARNVVSEILAKRDERF
jgi:hypothetical protein